MSESFQPSSYHSFLNPQCQDDHQHLYSLFSYIADHPLLRRLPSPTRHRSNHHRIALRRTSNTTTTTTVHIVSAYFQVLQYFLPYSLGFASLKFLESSIIVIPLKIIIIGTLATVIGHDMECDWR